MELYNFKTYRFPVNLEEELDIYKWCSDQFGKEGISWLFRWERNNTEISVYGMDNIVLFELTWSDYTERLMFL